MVRALGRSSIIVDSLNIIWMWIDDILRVGLSIAYQGYVVDWRLLHECKSIHGNCGEENICVESRCKYLCGGWHGYSSSIAR